ncbi:MAG TPA: ATP-binding protein [Burkholderiales bacterium]|nr:ATP-binding protein [Burkholderiales bacterium]
MSIAQRMSAGFGVLLLALGALLACVFVWQADSARAQKTFTEESRPLSYAANDLETGVLRVAIRMRAYFLKSTVSESARFHQAVQDVRENFTRLRNLRMSADDAQQVEQLAPLLQQYLSAAEETVAARRAEKLELDADTSVAALRENLLASLQGFIDLQSANTTRSLLLMEEAQQRVARGLVVTAILATALFLLLAWRIIDSIRKPARELVSIARALEVGDWKPALAWAVPPSQKRETNNEMQHIAHAFGAAAVALERREQRLAADHQVAGATASSLDKKEIGATALRAIVTHAGAEIGVLYCLNDKAQLAPIVCYGMTETNAALALGDGMPGQAALDQKIVHVQDIPDDSLFSIKLGYDQAPARDVVAVPILFGGQTLGVLVVASLRRLDSLATDFLQTAAEQLGIGLNNVKTHEQMLRLMQDVERKGQRIQEQNEELQAQNEEIQAQSEEVQAQNEELQAQSEEIRAQNEQLAEQAEHLHAQAKLLTEADQRKTEFLGLLAHELRNPMAGISNSLFVLSRPGIDEQRVAGAHAIIDRQTKQLGRLIDDLLDVTRITRGKIKLKPAKVDFVEVVRHCVEDQRAGFERVGIEIHLELGETPVTVEGDRVRLCQIVSNLIDNAVKFSDGGKHVYVRIRADRDAGIAELEVADEGMGIDSVAFARLFQPFSQGDPSLTRKNSGLGLGLALVKSLVELHGGEVTAHSEGVGKGASFKVRLPLLSPDAKPEPAPTHEAVAARTDTTPCRILIIEDNIDVARSLAAAIRMDGHDVRVEHSAKEGLALARSFRPDIVLCDIGLPTMDGYELARRFRAEEALKDAHLVAVTGYASEHDQEQAVRAGFDQHLPKPPDLQRLSALLADVAIRKAKQPNGN